MKLLAAVLTCGACTIDPVARAELTGAASGTAIFQKAGTSSQVSFQISLEGEDGEYAVAIEDGTCEGGTEWARIGTVDVSGGLGILRGVRDDWDIGGDEDVVGRLVVARRALIAVSCGEIFNSD
jgi:hypothetical protein